MSKSNPAVNLQMMTNCPMCDFKYDSKKDIKVIDKKDGMVTLYLNCEQCKSSLIVAVMIEPFGVTSISMMTDIVENDLKKINGDFIKYDDVLEVHKFLERN
ncbi:MAG: hypothetical protein U9N04_01250 [Patescibacteria group bacterium]|nr:hypothetical protein [Patescibacteria group bacterium]